MYVRTIGGKKDDAAWHFGKKKTPPPRNKGWFEVENMNNVV